MIIVKAQPDAENYIRIHHVVRILLISLENNVPTVHAAVDPLKAQGQLATFIVKKEDDTVDMETITLYVASLHNENGTWHLFGEKPSIIQS